MINTSKTVAEQMPEKWRFYTSDFSQENSGTVWLILKQPWRSEWMHLSDEDRAKTKLHAAGFGSTFEEALQDAIKDSQREEFYWEKNLK